GYVWLPVGDDSAGSMVSTGKLRGMPMVTVGGTVDRLLWGADVGVDLRPSQVYANVTQGNTTTWAAGVGYQLDEARRWQVGLETFGGITMEEAESRNLSVEVLGSGRWRFVDDFVGSVAAGAGIAQGLGTPQARAVLAVEYSPTVGAGEAVIEDADKDGIIDSLDACPEVAGVSSTEPQKHGCPLPKDSDGDGVPDSVDACLVEAGPASADATRNGCPLPKDSDNDGIVDVLDNCPTEAGIVSSDPGRNGCAPPKDSDNDGIVDPQDACPNEAGVLQSEPGKNGCPLPKDSDGDGVADPQDACPAEAGLVNSDPANNGCPKIRIANGEVVVLQVIEFENAKSKIQKSSGELLDEIADVLKAHPEIAVLEIQGHTDDEGKPRMNKTLSKDRANAVRQALVRRGVAAKRLKAAGYGQEKPLVPNDSDENRAKNRRVQFVILKTKEVEAPKEKPAAKVEAAKPEETKVEAAKPEETKVEAAKPEETKVEAAKPEETKADEASVESGGDDDAYGDEEPKPKAEKPAAKPKAEKPAAKPKAEKPAGKPKAEKPAAKPKAEKPKGGKPKGKTK
ncbi:MAG: OmpA family protein, partial [Deltaproteobacteria bacterium]|nr:OmpA family protein [Deltaproteobacteria bacterium]